MAYQKQTWRNLPDRTTPITAERLEHMETQYDEASEDLNSAISSLNDVIEDKASVTYVDDKVSQIEGLKGILPRVSIEYKTWGSSYHYKKVQIHVEGSPSPDVLHKRVEVPPEASGSDLKPTQFFINEEIDKVGASLMFNASGWRTSGNIGELVGAQFIDGVARHSMSTSGWQESDCIAMCDDGILRAYSAINGDFMEDMEEDGVIWSVGFGPVLIREGSKLTLDPGFWGPRRTAKSSLSVLGQRPDGDIIILYGPGVTNNWGFTWDDAASIAESEGCHVAMVLDQGGSTQMWSKGVPLIPSSDTGVEAGTTSEPGRRKIPDALYTTLPVESPLIPRGIPVNLPSGFQENNSDTPLVYTDGVKTWLSGQVKPVSGKINAPYGVVVGTAPTWVSNSRENIGLAKANGVRLGKLVWEPDGQISVYSGEDLNYVVLDGDSWPIYIPDNK